jgi:hypothetical protein
MDQHLIQLYCIAFGLTFASRRDLNALWGGEEEWEGVRCAGIDHMGTPYIIQEDDGRVKVVTDFATGEADLMEDVWTYVSEAQVKGGKLLHAV